MLVPEISLTPQTIQRFRGRCGEVAVLHSHLRQRRARRPLAARSPPGRCRSSSAPAAPSSPRRGSLGLIVIDEEHEGSFKQESTPRYHARDVAVMRARLENIPILLGSATPSLESWHNAQRGQYTLLTLPNRVLDRPLPQVALDRPAPRAAAGGRLHAPQPEPGTGHARRPARRRPGDAAAQSPRLLHARPLPRVRPRRAVPVLRPGADVPPAARRAAVPLLRLRAGAARQLPAVRPAARSATRAWAPRSCRAEIEAKFPGYVVRRMDSDTMRRPGSHARVLDGLPHAA